MAATIASNKTKIAKRVIEVFDFFDRHGPSATVMDIVRRYGRPQSSTSELLASLVEMGLLYKDARSRSYSPTPRLATLGVSAQPALIRDGRLFAFMDRLAATTRHTAALFGIVGTQVQVFRAAPGHVAAAARALGGGAADTLSASAAGLLLLAAGEADQARRMLWRLNAEAAPDDKFSPAEAAERLTRYRATGQATGPAGFARGLTVTAALLPVTPGERPLALGVAYPADAGIDAAALGATLSRGIAACARGDDCGAPLAPLAAAL